MFKKFYTIHKEVSVLHFSPIVYSLDDEVITSSVSEIRPRSKSFKCLYRHESDGARSEELTNRVRGTLVQ